ncbi:hypothetical protein DMA11_05315 [Marinilabiliaceae bacterium JC017]|nr:hypothetical protein DMA11_05315 [Marinilabiliaceae bacterium JC017]
MKKLLYVFATLLILIGCNKEEAITPKGGEDKYIPKFSDTEWGGMIYQLYKDYGVSFVYEFERTIYDWDMVSDTKEKDTLKYVQNETVLPTRITFLKEQWLSSYTDKFIKEKFPYRVLLVDSLTRITKVSTTDFLSMAGLNHVTITRMGDSFEATDKKALLNSVNTSLLADYLFAKGFLVMPEAFYMVSGIELYGTPTNNPSGDPSVFYNNGFFPIYNSWNNYKYLSGKYPTKEEDVHAFVEFYVSTPADEVEAAIGMYPKMMEKYEILHAYLQPLGVNLH